MQYTYDTYAYVQGSEKPRRIDVTTNFLEAELRREGLQRNNEFAFTLVTNNSNFEETWTLDTIDSWENWRLRLERAFSWKEKVKEAIPVEKKFVDEVVDKVFDLHTKHIVAEKQVDWEIPREFQIASDPQCDNPHNPRSPSNQHSGPKTPPTVFGMTPIDPPHYQRYVDDYQWMETMCRIPRYREHPNEFIAALEMQVRKYLDRAGRKDEDFQELQKGLWYYKFMVAYIKNGCVPILVKDVNDILVR